jgi:MFS transporter, ACS family, tartrate transporter
MARVSARLVPFLSVCYFIAYLDRVNVSFAALTMNKDLGLSIFFLTLWFPAAYRARVIGYFMAAIPLSTVIGAPYPARCWGSTGSSACMAGSGCSSWKRRRRSCCRWVSCSISPTSPLTPRGCATKNGAGLWTGWRPRNASAWRRGITACCRPLLNPRVLALSLVYFGAVATNYGLSFFLPQIVKALGMTNLQTGFVSAIPYVVGVVSIVWWGHRSDAKLERRFHTAFPIFVAAAGLTVAAFLDDPRAKMVAFSVAGFGIFGALPVFWTLPTAFLFGAAAAGGIAIIDSIGNLAGFAEPSVMGLIKDSTGSFTDGLLVLAGAAIVAMVIVLALGHDTALERTPARDPSPAE